MVLAVLYPERDLNPHSRNGHWILSPACLPIPPSGRINGNPLLAGANIVFSGDPYNNLFKKRLTLVDFNCFRFPGLLSGLANAFEIVF